MFGKAKWNVTQWAGASLILAAIGILGWMAVPEPHAKPSVPLTELGLAPDHTERAAVIAATMPKFRLVGDAAAEDNTRKNVRLWDAMLQIRGSHFPNQPQEVGDCVSWGAANAVNYLQAVQLVRGPPSGEEFHPAYPPWIYGASRVWVGQKHGSHFRGDGSVGAYAAEALNQYGCLRADHEKVPPYSGAVAREWGSKGPPAWAKDVAKPFLVQTVAQINSAAEARDAICNGFPVTIASGWWGTNNIPVVDGRRVAQRTTSWGHQQCLIAYDGSGREPLFYCLNSWGPNAHPAPMQGEPPGGYWIRMKDVEHICGEGDSWALSAFDGFPSEKIDWDRLLRRPVSAAAGPVPDGPKKGDGIMFQQFVQQCGPIAACVLLAGVGLALFRGGRRSVAAATILFASLASAGLLHAQQNPDPMNNAFTQAVNRPVEKTEPVDWVGAVNRPVIQSSGIPWESACSRVVETKQSKPPETAMVPFSAAVWFDEYGRYPTVDHLVAHGCPKWVAEMYSGNPDLMGRIHGGYHEGSPKLLVTRQPVEKKSADKVKAAPQPITVKQIGNALYQCNGNSCRQIQPMVQWFVRGKK